MRTALALCGIQKTEEQVAKLLNTNRVRGTWHKYFPLAAEKFRLNYRTMRNAGFGDLKECLTKDLTVILCVYYPARNVDHYLVLKKIDRVRIYCWDPLFGEEHAYSLAHFKKIWRDDPSYDNEKGWFFALQKQ